MLANGYPLLSDFWILSMFAGLVLWISMVTLIFIGNFRRRDHSG